MAVRVQIEALKDGSTFIVEVQPVDRDGDAVGAKWVLDGVPGSTVMDAMEWVIDKMRQAVTQLGGKIDDDTNVN